jgi:hypothetical protein
MLGLHTYLSLAWVLVVLNTLALWVWFHTLTQRLGPQQGAHWVWRWLLWGAVFLPPSVWVWSSGLLRESLSLAGLALVLSGALGWPRRAWCWNVFYLVLGGGLLGLFHPWLGLAACPFLGVAALAESPRLAAWYARRPGRRYLLGGAVIVLLGLGGVAAFRAASPNQQNLWRYMQDLRAWSLYKGVAHNRHHLSTSALDTLQRGAAPQVEASVGPNWKTGLRLASGAVAAVYLEPWPQQVQGPLAGVMLLENVFYLVLFGGGVAGLFIARNNPRGGASCGGRPWAWLWGMDCFWG